MVSSFGEVSSFGVISSFGVVSSFFFSQDTKACFHGCHYSSLSLKNNTI